MPDILFSANIGGISRDVMDCGYIPVGTRRLAGLEIARLPEEPLQMEQVVECGETSYKVAQITEDRVSLVVA